MIKYVKRSLMLVACAVNCSLLGVLTTEEKNTGYSTLSTLKNTGLVEKLKLSVNGKYLGMAITNSPQAGIYDLVNNKMMSIDDFWTISEVSDINFSADEKLFSVAYANGNLNIFSTDEGKLISSIKDKNGTQILKHVFSKESDKIGLLCADATYSTYNVNGGDCISLTEIDLTMFERAIETTKKSVSLISLIARDAICFVSARDHGIIAFSGWDQEINILVNKKGKSWLTECKKKTIEFKKNMFGFSQKSVFSNSSLTFDFN